MDVVLLDTNIVSFIFKKDSRAKSFETHLKGKILGLTFMTVAELFQWAAIRNWSDYRIQKMEHELRKYLIFPFDINTCRLWGQIRANRRKMGQPISPQDAWIAATACQYDIPLITHNPVDFKSVKDLEIITNVK